MSLNQERIAEMGWTVAGLLFAFPFFMVMLSELFTTLQIVIAFCVSWPLAFVSARVGFLLQRHRRAFAEKDINEGVSKLRQMYGEDPDANVHAIEEVEWVEPEPEPGMAISFDLPDASGAVRNADQDVVLDLPAESPAHERSQPVRSEGEAVDDSGDGLW